MKLAFIVQRYGREIPGGSETLARQIAERLARRHQIDVLTTTARDYMTWRNEYPESEEKLRGVRVVRFPVEQERDLDEFNRFSDWIYSNPHTREDELRWLEMQGPVTPKLIEYLKNEHERYDLLVFFTYLYYPTYYGIQVAPEKSVLVPTAHDEPPLKLEIYKDVFNNASSFIFNTEAEELLVLERFDVHRRMRETIGIGMDPLEAPDTTAFRRHYRASNRFLLYAGRIDEGKGCGELVNFFQLFREEHPEFGNLQLLLIGKKNMAIPRARDVRYLGFLGEDEKLAAMAAATAVVIPSRLESLSIVALEALSVGTPVIVHGGSRVLVEHCRKANAGLYYTSYEEFEGILEVLLGDKNLARGLGRQGQQYIRENFGWDKLLAHYELALRSSAREQRPAVTSERTAGGRLPGRDHGPFPPHDPSPYASSESEEETEQERQPNQTAAAAEEQESGLLEGPRSSRRTSFESDSGPRDSPGTSEAGTEAEPDQPADSEERASPGGPAYEDQEPKTKESEPRSGGYDEPEGGVDRESEPPTPQGEGGGDERVEGEATSPDTSGGSDETGRPGPPEESDQFKGDTG